MQDTIVIKISGDSGDGIQLAGEQLTITAALNGHEVRTLPDFPAEIRAPAGTVGGISGFQLAMSDAELFTAGETLDVLVALNPAALKKSLSFLQEGGLLIVNEDNLTERDFAKAGLQSNYLDAIRSNYHILSIPLTTNTLLAVEGSEISNTLAKKTANFYILGVILWLFELDTTSSVAFIEKKFAGKPEVLAANKKALQAGFNYALTLELARQEFTVGKITRLPGEYRQITGIEAVSMAVATVAVGTDREILVAGYPITPASAILQECAKLQDYGVKLFQAEDEIAAVCACLGAAFGGNLALTSTSGPGFDLKTEGLGLGVVTELPLVVIDVQRAGASTGLPTKTGQADLDQAIFGRHGEAPIPVLAPLSPADCFNVLLEAFTIAVKYMTPVIILMDAWLANAAEPWNIPPIEDIFASKKFPSLNFNRFPEPFRRDEHASRSWNLPGTPGFIHQLGGLEKQGDFGNVSYEADNHQQMVNLRRDKIAGIAKDYEPLEIWGAQDAEILLIGWGSTAGSLKAAVTKLGEENIKVALLSLRYLNPLPQDLTTILAKYSHIFVAELNTGQLCRILRAEYLRDIKSINQCNGQAFSVDYVVRGLKTAMEIKL